MARPELLPVIFTMTSGALRITLAVFLALALAENFTPLVDAGEVPDRARAWSRLAVLAAFCDRTRKPFSNHPSSGSNALMGHFGQAQELCSSRYTPLLHVGS